MCYFYCVVKVDNLVKVTPIMNTFATETTNSAIDWLRQLADQTQAFQIGEVVPFHRSPSRHDRAGDYRVSITPRGASPLHLILEVKARLNPQIAWESLDRLRSASSDGIPTVYCPVISPRVAGMCREAGVSYFDGNGNAHLEAPGFLVHVESQGRRAKTTRMDDGVDPFASKSSRLTRVLLGSPGTLWQVQTIATQAQISIGLASRIKDALLYQRFLEPVGGRFRVLRPRELLEAWADHYKQPATAVPLYLMGSPSEVEDRVARWSEDRKVGYALTQFSGAWRVAPMVRYQRSTIYLALDPAVTLLDDLINDLGAKRVETGANVSLWPTRDPAVFFGARQKDHMQIVSPVQLYLDLQGQTGRGQEAASEVFAKEIAPTFEQTGGEAGV